MKANLKNWGKKVMTLLLAVMMLASTTALAVSPSEMVFTDYGKGYHLTDFLRGYNVLAFGNAHLNLHAMGALLVQGEYSGGSGNSGFADGKDLPPSYIKGELSAPNSVYNSRNSNTNAPLYVGSAANTVKVTGSESAPQYQVNGLYTGNGGKTPAYTSDKFFNFNEAYAVVKADQGTMLSRSSGVVTDVYGKITINMGDNVTISSLQGIHTIDIVGDIQQEVNTTINVVCAGDVSMPNININGTQPQVKEQDDTGVSIVWNFTQADSVTLPTMNWIGHVIAPDSNVSQGSGNYNGCIICKNLYSGAEGHVYDYHAQETSWEVLFSLTKVWRDNDDADGIRPDSIRVDLLADNQKYGETVTLTAADNWYHVWSDLPQKNADGKDIVYSVYEHPVEGYESEYIPEKSTLVNTHTPELIDVRGVKSWAGESMFGNKMRPKTITVCLYADGVKVATQAITDTTTDTQTYEFKNLPRYNNGKEIRYVVHEEYVGNYISSHGAGYDLVNTWGATPIEISGMKIWNDDHNRDGLRPAQVTIQLLANGEVLDEHVVSAANEWKYSFTNLSPEDGDGNKITYTVREKEAIAGYETSVSGYNITNTHAPALTSVSGSKTWNDNNNNDGMRPSSITVTLLANGEPVDDQVVTAENGWAWTFNNVPMYKAGQLIRYRVTEEAVPGYTAQTNGMDLINTHMDETVDVAGSKTWNDRDNIESLRPASITIRLLADGVEKQTKTVTAADGWAWSFTGLPKYAQGRKIEYTITEDPVTNYTSIVSGYNVTNSREVETISISAVKTWNDDDNRDGLRPHGIVFRLYKQLSPNDTLVEVDSCTVIPDAEGNWIGTFANLPKYEQGQQIIYTIAEDPVPGYTQSVGDNGIVNTHVPEKTSVKGEKIWNDADNQDGVRPESVTVCLLADGVEVQRLQVSAESGWHYEFTNLNRYKNVDGTVSEIAYTVKEEPVEGYTTEYIPTEDGFDVRNTHAPETIELTGSKVWNDNNNQDGIRPARVIIRLLANNQPVSQRTVTAADGWVWSFKNLPKKHLGQVVQYSIMEDAVPGYTTAYTNQGNAYTVTNTHQPEMTYITGEKRWVNKSGAEHEDSHGVTIALYKNGEKIAEKHVTEQDNWRWTFDNLVKYENGQEIVYTVAEENVDAGHTVTNERTTVTDENGVTHQHNIITNSYEPAPVHIAGAKVWRDNNNQDGLRPASITIRLLADGVEAASKTITPDANGSWSWSFDKDQEGHKLTRYRSGDPAKGEIVYTIREDAVTGYASQISGYNAINTHVPETVSITGSKTWNDQNNQDGKRPDDITIRLWAQVGNGTPHNVKDSVVTAEKNWSWTFVDLPKYHNGELVTYSITEDTDGLPQGYTSQVSGYNVTNTYTPETRTISGSKTWDDKDNQDGKRPSSIVINLLADEVQVASKTVTAADNWSWAFENLPVYAGGRRIVYTITEEPVADYASAVHGHSVTNHYTPETVTLSGSKTWMDQNNQDGKRPASITIRLLADGVEKDHKIITAADNWSWTFVNLPKYEQGREIAYTIVEDAIAGYDTTINGMDVTNRYTPETVSVHGSKTWVDGDDRDAKRPSSIVIRLLADGEEVRSSTITVADGWAWRFDHLPKYKNVNGVVSPIVYTIAEDTVQGYTTTVNGYNVTNSYTPSTIDISGKKTWDDSNNQDGKRPVRILVHLLADGTEVARRYVGEADGWAWSFHSLPENKNVNGHAVKISYTVYEEPVDGYTTSVRGYNITNSYNPETVNVSGSKVWDDANNQDGRRPSSITVRLLANGREVDSKTVTPSLLNGDWAWSFDHLPKYESGRPIRYTISEDPVEHYTSTVNGYNLVNHYKPETVSVSGSKTWADDNDRDGLRPDEIIINLHANGAKVSSKHVTAEDGWKWTFANLPKYHQGKAVNYTITEEPVAGYEAVVSGYDVTNTHVPATVSISSTKTWSDDQNRDGLRPHSVTLRLYKQLSAGDTPVEVDSRTVSAGKDGSWIGQFGNLPKYENGKELIYTIREDAVPGYTVSYDGLNVTNTHVPAITSLKGQKIWNDSNNQDGLRPESITIHLLADGTKKAEKTVTAADNWAWSFDQLPEFDGGREIVYTITEEAVNGYTPEYIPTENGFNVRNTHQPETIALRGAKVWDDNGNQDGIRPARVVIRLLADGQPAFERTVTAADQWSWTFTDLPKNRDNGTPIQYTITEDVVTGYTTAISKYDAQTGWTVTNTHEPETIYVSGKKVWVNNTAAHHDHPEQVTIALYADGTEVNQTIARESDDWEWTFTNLPKYQNGQRIVYTVDELDVPDDHTVTVHRQMLRDSNAKEYYHYVITNTYEPELVHIQGEKRWLDENNQDGLRPSSIIVNLLADGVKINSRTVTEQEKWSWNFQTDADGYALKRYKTVDGVQTPIQYTITEEPVTGYDSVISGFNAVNTHKPQTVRIAGRKVWDDANNQDGKRPVGVTIRLYKQLMENGAKTEVSHSRVTAEKGWAWAFVDLPRYENGREIIYTISEDPVEGYTPSIVQEEDHTYTVTNSYTPQTRAISGSKTWDDQNNQDGKRPSSIVINLLADGAKVAEKTVKAADNWAWTFDQLPVYAGGKQIVYTITEDAVVDYISSVHGHSVINHHRPEEIDLTGKKVWDDHDNQDGMRPDSITVRLYADGVEKDHRIVKEDEHWAWAFTDLPKYHNGQQITYTITEDAVPGYTPDISRYDEDGDGWTLTNTHQPGKVTVSGSKTWDDANNQDGLRPDSITINLLRNGTVVQQKNVTAQDGWAWSFTDLDQYTNGKLNEYTITEEPVAGYTAKVEGYNVTNSHKPGVTKMDVYKTWNDRGNRDGMRPKSITVHLLADGQVVASKTITEADGWNWTFAPLPEKKNGQTIVYTLSEDPVPGYTTQINGSSVINAYDPVISVSGKKIWNDNEDAAGERPQSIVIHLLADGTQIAQKTVTAAENWTWTFDNLPKYSGDRLIAYSVQEDAVKEYTTEYPAGTYDVKNTYNVKKTFVTAKKTWQDEEDKAGRRPASITIHLLADGQRIKSKVLTAAENWTWTFEDLDQYTGRGADRRAIEYTIEEEPVAGYRTVIDGYHVTNVYDLTAFSVTKIWQGRSESADIGLVLSANGVPVDQQPAYQRSGNVYTWDALPKTDAEGNDIVYAVTEIPMAGYRTSYVNKTPHAMATDCAYDGGEIVNLALTDVSVRKVWKGMDDAAKRPAIRLTLLCNDQVVNRPQPAPDAEGWYTYTGLPMVVDGKEAVYKVVETPVDGFITTYVNANGATDAAYPGGTICNSVLPATGDHSSLLMYLSAMAFSVAGLLLLYRRRITL